MSEKIFLNFTGEESFETRFSLFDVEMKKIYGDKYNVSKNDDAYSGVVIDKEISVEIKIQSMAVKSDRAKSTAGLRVKIQCGDKKWTQGEYNDRFSVSAVVKHIDKFLNSQNKDVDSDKETVKSTPNNNQSADSLSIKEILVKIKNLYSKNEDFDEMISDLSDGECFDNWAERFLEEDFGNNKELAKALYILQIDKCEDAYDYKQLAESFIEHLKDKDMALVLYKKSADLLEDADDYKSLASSVVEFLNNKIWAKELYEKAVESSDSFSDDISIANDICSIYKDSEWAIILYKKLEDKLVNLGDYNLLIDGINSNLSDKVWTTKIASHAVSQLKSTEDMFEFAGYSSEIVDLANFIAIEDGLNDKNMAKELFELIKKYEGVTDLLDAAREVKEIYNKEYFTKYSHEIVDRSIELVDTDYYCDIYVFLKDDLEDDDRANKYKNKYDSEMQLEESYEDIFDGSDSDSDVDEIDYNSYEDHDNIIGFDLTQIFAPTDIEELVDEKKIDLAKELANEKIEEFVDELKSVFEGVMDNNILLGVGDKLFQYKPVDDFILDGIVDQQYKLYIKINKQVPSDMLNKIFLDLDGFGFSAIFENDDEDEVIIQGYDNGEYDSGYFSHDQDTEYINNFDRNWKEYPVAKTKMI